MSVESYLVPVVHEGVVLTGCRKAPGLRVRLSSGEEPDLLPVGQSGQWLLAERPRTDLTLYPDDLPPVKIQVSGWAGQVDRVQGGVISGWARNLRQPGQDLAVVAFDLDGIAAVATARAEAAGRFRMELPPRITGAGKPCALRLGIAGSDYLLQDGLVRLLPASRTATGLQVQLQPLQALAIRVKISTPNLKEAPMWGDYHFANSLAAGFERLGHQATVDTADVWYAHPTQEDVVLTIRGRHRVEIDRTKINLLWIISHPDRIPDEELADYDHVAVASDVYAQTLRGKGVASVSVLHQAADAHLFQQDPDRMRRSACLFVGNSRREYRTMVKWCLQKDLPLELYGGGWGGVLPPGYLRGTAVANADLPDFYGSHLMLLNDHWDSMRENGFLSNRLFDGSAVATPILTDSVAGLADVFGDTISQAGDIETFAATVQACMADPQPFLERAQRAHDIVKAAHTFDHRAAELAEIIDRIAARKRLGI